MEPTQAQLDYLKRFEAWMQYLISMGAQTQAGADEIYNSIIDDMELGVTELNRLPFYSQVQSWAVSEGKARVRQWQDQAVAYQRATEASREYQNELSAFRKVSREASEAKGAAREQAQVQLRTLRANLQKTADLQAQRTEKFRASQQALQVGAAQFRQESIRDRELRRMAQPTGKRIPSLKEAYSPFLEGLPERAKEYWRTRMGVVSEKFGTERQEARAKWWTQQQTPVVDFADEPTMGFTGFKEKYGLTQKAMETTLARFEVDPRAGEFAGLSPEQRADLQAVRTMAGGATFALPRKTADPWETYVSQFPFLEEFKMLPAYERGVRPSKYRPPTRWLSF